MYSSQIQVVIHEVKGDRRPHVIDIVVIIQHGAVDNCMTVKLTSASFVKNCSLNCEVLDIRTRRNAESADT